MGALTEACNTHDAINIGKNHAKSTPAQQVLMGKLIITMMIMTMSSLIQIVMLLLILKMHRRIPYVHS